MSNAMSPAAFAARTITRELVAAAPARWPCEPVKPIECPRGCGFLAAPTPHLMWGPWRMQSHLMSPRCPAAIPGLTTTRKGRR